MTATFRRHGQDVRMEIEEFELELLRTVAAGLQRVLDDPASTDPVVQRLFPACVEGDDVVDAEVRNLIYEDLLRARLEGLEAVLGLLAGGHAHRGKVRVDLHEDEPHLVLGVLNDLRLALGVQVGIDHLDRSTVSEDHPAAWALAVMDHFAWLQEQLIRVLDPSSASEPEA